jgi:FSR family fosmidomycin resistance protein-like MFS transporter
MIPAMYPLLKEAYRLDFTQVGLITLAFQVTSSLLQPLLGYVTDHRPWPYAMVAGMAATLSGLVGLASAGNYAMVLVSAALVGLGSAVFHPEATRMARHAAAGQQGFAQAFSRSAAMPDTRLGRCWQPCSLSPADRPASPGCRWWRSRPCC